MTISPGTGHRDSGEATVPAPKSLPADGLVGDFSFTGLFNAASDLVERSQEILRGEFANHADADR